ncbi:hypothetical protein AVEN_133352-1 [Araneus ventricosus]|uniref:Uncharacterized protein n=1 Tax=Araneus ventricosus TaxID=182803 RepID=A0A4Y2DMR1_ARAVE|nr:hypothetical protein AVEN_133352-1 [Araneus ventricosus]
MNLCDQKLLKKCLHGKTQNYNESFNNVVRSIVPKETFVELQTLRLGISIAIILFNSGFAGLLSVFQKLGVLTGPDLKMFYWSLDNMRIVDSTRHSKPFSKQSRKKRRTSKICKILKFEVKEDTTYKPGEF